MKAITSEKLFMILNSWLSNYQDQQGFIQAPNNLRLTDLKTQSKFQFSNWIFFE